MKTRMKILIVLVCALAISVITVNVWFNNAIAQGISDRFIYLPLITSPSNVVPNVDRTYPADYDTVFEAVLAVLNNFEEPVSLADPERGLINSGSVDVTNQQLREIVPEELLDVVAGQDGRYLLSFYLTRESDETTNVDVAAFIIIKSGKPASAPTVASPIGGRPVASNGTLETAHLEAIERYLSGPVIQSPPAFNDSCCEPLSVSLATATDIQVNQPDHNVGTLDNNTTQSETSVSVFGSTVVVGWNDSSQFAVTGAGGFTSMTGYGFSNDGGATFTDAGLLAPAPGFANFGDPSLAVDSSGNFYFASLTSDSLGVSRIAVAQSTSITPAVTFGTPVLLAGLINTGSPFQDKELIAVDATGGPFEGRVYVAWTEFANIFDATPQIIFARSTITTPLTFAAPVALSPRDALNQGVMPVVGPDGELYVAWGRFDAPAFTTQSVQLLKSTDGGVTFVNPDPSDPAANKTVVTSTPAPGFMTSAGIVVRTRGFPYIAVDGTPTGSPTRGNIYVVYQADPDNGGPDRSDIFFTSSTDGGATWSTAVSVNKAPAVTGNPDTTNNDNWMPSIAVSPSNGEIIVTFYDRRNDTGAGDGNPANTNITLFKAVSTDAGATWSNEQVSDVAFTPSVGYDPLIVAEYMGDYNFTTADASGFYLTWGDTRNPCAAPGGAVSPCSPVGRFDQDVFFEKVPTLADLSITKTASADVVDAGGSLLYEISVTNNGPSNASNVVVVDTLPLDASYDVDTDSCTLSVGTGIGGADQLTCELGDIAIGDTASFTVQVTVDADAGAGSPTSITNVAEVSADQEDPDLSNNTASVTTIVNNEADLRVYKECKPDRPVAAGDEAVCTIWVENLGPSTARDVVAIDEHVSDGTFYFGDVKPDPECNETSNPQNGAGTVTCNLGDIVAGDTITITVPEWSNDWIDLNDHVTVTSDTFDPDPGNNQDNDHVEVRPIADLAISKEDFPDPVTAGATLTYTLTITNMGPSNAEDVRVEDVLPAGVTVTTVDSSPVGVCAPGTPGSAAHPTTCVFGNLANNDIATVTIVVQVHDDTLGPLHNNAQVFSDNHDPNMVDNFASTTTTVGDSADLAVTKTATPDPVNAGEELTYEVTITNNGPSEATDVALFDSLPPEVSFLGATISNGGGTCVPLIAPPNSVSCDLGALSPGSFVTVFITVLVDPATPNGAVITNTATVSSATGDPVPGNNTTVLNTDVLAEADVEILKDGSVDVTNPSPLVTYDINVINHGPSDALNVVFTDTLPLTPKKVVYTFDTGNGACAYDEPSHTVRCDLGTVEAGEAVEILIYVEIRGSVGVISNIVNVSSDTFDPDLENNVARKDLLIHG